MSIKQTRMNSSLSSKEIDGLIALIEYHKNEGWYNVVETTDLMVYESGQLLKKLYKMRDDV
jgi:hypothetical protein